MAKKILITGSGGLLGATTMSLLNRNGCEVESFKGDIRDEKSYEKYKGKQYDWVIHTAAVTNVCECEKNKDKCNDVNVYGTKRIVDFSKNVGARLLYTSTASVFSGEKGDYKEDDTPQPMNAYNVSKYQGENVVLEYDKGVVLRLNLIGIHPSESREKNFIEWLYKSILENKDLKLVKDVFVNPLSNITISEIVSLIIQQEGVAQVLHIGSRDKMSKAEIANLFIKKFPSYTGVTEEISVDALDGPHRPKEMWLNTSQTEEILNIRMPDLASEVEKIFNFTEVSTLL